MSFAKIGNRNKGGKTRNVNTISTEELKKMSTSSTLLRKQKHYVFSELKRRGLA